MQNTFSSIFIFVNFLSIVPSLEGNVDGFWHRDAQEKGRERDLSLEFMNHQKPPSIPASRRRSDSWTW